ncbi:3-keto-disaccharide hydrolase [Parapedobacter sp. DT-150]|uniref:3-keto-disaccharide hydrolase n=1 Tax=Parapedobacter sp. DT-150 TaxID=3396162 RepID=UPI003F1A934C
MTIRSSLCFLFPLLLIFAAIAQEPNTLSHEEQANGWQLLFDGESFNGLQKLAEGGWEIKNGTLSATPIPHGKQMDIITDKLFENFELTFDFSIYMNTNSGVKYLVKNDFTNQKGVYLGLEYQILDDENYKYPERGNLRSTASLYDLIPAGNQKKLNGFGQWNTAKIIVNRNLISHWLNGDKIVEYDRDSQSFQELTQQSKYKDLQHFGKAKKGHLLFQNEGTPVAFRNIKIKNLD